MHLENVIIVLFFEKIEVPKILTGQTQIFYMLHVFLNNNYIFAAEKQLRIKN